MQMVANLSTWYAGNSSSGMPNVTLDVYGLDALTDSLLNGSSASYRFGNTEDTCLQYSSSIGKAAQLSLLQNAVTSSHHVALARSAIISLTKRSWSPGDNVPLLLPVPIACIAVSYESLMHYCTPA